VLNTTGSRVEVYIYPFKSWVAQQSVISLNYALRKAPLVNVTDGSFTYQSLFDTMYDAVSVALSK